MHKSLKILLWFTGSLLALAAGIVVTSLLHDRLTVKTYGYDHYAASQYDFARFDGPTTGEMAGDFTVTDLEGRPVRLSDFRGRAVVLETGSLTCPMYVSRLPDMSTLVPDFPEVDFLVLYVREAHPGNRLGQPRSAEEKLALARLLPDLESERRRILVDDVSGTAHRKLGAWPNMAYVIDTQGVVRHRQQWTDPALVREVLLALRQNQSVPPMIRRLTPPDPAVSRKVLTRAGFVAVWDFVATLPGLLLGHAAEPKVAPPAPDKPKQ